MVNTYNLQRLVQQMMSKTQLEEEIAFPFNTGMPDLVLAYFHQNMLFCVCVCVCV